MSDLTLPGVPESIPFSRVADLFRTLGIDPNTVPVGCVVRFGPHAIDFDIYACDTDGNRYLAADDENTAMHHITIPITSSEEATS